jgi:hypothetical protein
MQSDGPLVRPRPHVVGQLSAVVEPSGGATPAMVRIGRPEMAAILALQMYQGALVAQQVLPMRAAVPAV